MDFVLQHAVRESSPGGFVACWLKEAVGRGFIETFCRGGPFKDCVACRSYRQSWSVGADPSLPLLWI